MIAVTVTWGIKKVSAIPPCDDSTIPFLQTNKSITIVVGIDNHIQFRLAKYNISRDKIGGTRNIMIENIYPYCIKKSAIILPPKLAIVVPYFSISALKIKISSSIGNPGQKLNPLFWTLTPLGSLQNRVIKLYRFRSDYIIHHTRIRFDDFRN